MSKDKIYLSGPMTGVVNYNRANFNQVASDLIEAGFKVVNPVDIHFNLFGFKDDLSPDEYNSLLDIELKEVETCSAIYLLSGWENSKGAKLELKKALECGLKIILE